MLPESFSEAYNEKIKAKTLTVEIRDRFDKLVSKSISLKKKIETESEIVNNGITLLKELWANSRVRIVRVKLNNLMQINPQEQKDSTINKYFDNMKSGRSSTNTNNGNSERKSQSVKNLSNNKTNETSTNDKRKNKNDAEAPLKYKTIESLFGVQQININSTNHVQATQESGKKAVKRKATPAKAAKRGNKKDKPTPMKIKTLDNFFIKNPNK
jgi:hypothetical protein